MFHPGIPRTLSRVAKIIIFNPQGFAEVHIRWWMCLCFRNNACFVLYCDLVSFRLCLCACGGGLTSSRLFMLMLASDCTAVYYVANCVAYFVSFSVVSRLADMPPGYCLDWHLRCWNIYCLTAVSCFPIEADFHIFLKVTIQPLAVFTECRASSTHAVQFAPD